MISAKSLKKTLCDVFCTSITVAAVPCGYAVSSPFTDNSRDPIMFYLCNSDGGYVLEDDGSYLAHLIAKDISVHEGQRGNLLSSILAQANADFSRETFEIRTSPFAEQDLSRHAVDFLSALIRVRDLEFLTRDVVQSTFRGDALIALNQALGHAADLTENEAYDKHFLEFPADLVIRPKQNFSSAKGAALYFVNSNDKLNEALLLKMESERFKNIGFEVIALLEEMKSINSKKFQRAQNRNVVLPIFRGDEEAATNYIRQRLGIPDSQAA